LIKSQFPENKRFFYEEHVNFSCRTSLEYQISPGIRCKFDLIKHNLKSLGIKARKARNVLDLGCSGNSILFNLNGVNHKSFLDIALIPLKQYIRKSNLNNTRENVFNFYHPICAAITHVPYRRKVFDVVFALDVLEHVENDVLAIKEIHGIMKLGGILIITVPHGMKYYSNQDKIIGHYRRYETRDLILIFREMGFQMLKIFGVYGRLIAISRIQSSHSKKVEESILKLRDLYSNNKLFQHFWDVITKVFSKIMKWDVSFTPFRKMRNIGLIFVKS